MTFPATPINTIIRLGHTVVVQTIEGGAASAKPPASLVSHCTTMAIRVIVAVFGTE